MMDYTKYLIKQRLNVHNGTNGGHGALICKEGRGREILRKGNGGRVSKTKSASSHGFRDIILDRLQACNKWRMTCYI